jgi:F-type H+-transporting ATPase subunit b
MQEIIEAFGIDWRLIVIQIFNFGILAAVLWYFLYTPVLKLLAEREAKIKKGVEDAALALAAREAADKEKSQILKEAHVEATQIVARGTAHAEEKGKVMLAETNEKISREIANAKLTAEELKSKALKESEAEIAKLAILGAEKVLREEISK